MPRKIVLDVDTGTDDAIAIITAVLSPEIQVEAVCSGAGNKDIDKTTENTLRVIQLLDVDVPVYRGCSDPMVKFLTKERQPSVWLDTRFGEDAEEIQMHPDYLNLPESRISEQGTPAPIFYVDYLNNVKEPVTLVAVGPLTNIAMAFMLDPGILRNIEEIIIMGGGYNITNVSPAAEFNFWHDPEAAQRVIHCGARVVLVPLDATHEACITRSDCERFRAINTAASNFTADICEERIRVHNKYQPLDVPDAAAVHDALAVCYLIDPSVLKDVRHVHCDVGFSGFAEGQSIIDTRYYPEEKNCYFAFGGDRSKFADILCDVLKKSNQKYW
jgi:inosine-uridine nucleoside N-ribohydrolase